MKKKGEKKGEKNSDVHFGGNFNYGSQGAGNVQGNNEQYPWMPEGTHHSRFSSSFTTAYNVPTPYPPPAYPYGGGGGGYPPPYHHPRMPQTYGQKEEVVEQVKITKTKAAKKKAYEEEEEEKEEEEEEEEVVEEQKPPPKTEAQPKAAKPVAAAPDLPVAETATRQPQRPRKKNPPAAPADGCPGWEVAGGGYPAPAPQYGYPPQHGGGYPVQGYPAHPGHGGHGSGYEYYGYGYGAPPQHMGMGRLAAGTAAVHNAHEAYHRYRRAYGGYGHHGKFKQGHQGKYSHYYGPHRGGKFAVN